MASHPADLLRDAPALPLEARSALIDSLIEGVSELSTRFQNFALVFRGAAKRTCRLQAEFVSNNAVQDPE